MVCTGAHIRRCMKLGYRLLNASEQQANRYNYLPHELVSLRAFRNPVQSPSLTGISFTPYLRLVDCLDMPNQSLALWLQLPQ